MCKDHPDDQEGFKVVLAEVSIFIFLSNSVHVPDEYLCEGSLAIIGVCADNNKKA